MGKTLAEMSLSELWELFPIFLVPHNDMWTADYAEMKSALSCMLSNYKVFRISHIGSTAIEKIWAKNIIDILIEIENCEDMDMVSTVIENNGFIRMSSNADRISLNRGYTAHGFDEKVYHVHLRRTGDNDELYFRDYLNEYPQVAKEYEKLKLKLWKLYEHNRDAYTQAKSDFVNKITAEAKRIYTDRY